MLSTNYPIMFDNTEMIFPSDWQENSDVVENVNTTEAGTDQIEVIRMDKLTISAKYNVTDNWAAILKQFSKQNTIQVKRYDIATKAYDTRTMRMRNFQAVLRKKSHLLSVTNGIWEISFNLIEL